MGICGIRLPEVPTVSEVLEWLRLAKEGMRDLMAGRAAKPPPTLRIPQSRLQPWAPLLWHAHFWAALSLSCIAVIVVVNDDCCCCLC